MSIQLDLFPTIGKKLFDKIGYFSGEYQFLYHKDGYDIVLQNEANESHGQTQSVIHLIDSNCQWHANMYDLCFKKSCIINNPNFLFGENGVAVDEATIGIAVMWSSKTSSQRGIIKCSEFQRQVGKVSIDIEGCFPPGQLKGTVIFDTVLYLKQAPEISPSYYARKPGTILGVLDTITVIIDGNGSVFPIVEVQEPGYPLWYVVCKWSDPLSDPFDEENVELRINTANPAYNYLKVEEGLKESPFLKEILASAMQTIILNAMQGEYWNDIVNGENLDEGSIGQAINYFISTFGWDYSSPERLAMSIRKDFESRI